MIIDIPQIIYFTVLGLIGGLTYVFMHSDDWEDFTKFDAAKRIILGGIIGGLYWILYTEHNFPNMAMTFVSGYMGTDFIEKLVQKMSTQKEESKT